MCVIVEIETDSPSRLTVGVQEKQTTTQSHNSYRRTVDNIVRHPFPEYMHLSHPDHIPFVSCHRITNPHCRSILRQASELHRSATLHATKTVNRNPHRSFSHLPCMNSNLASHLHLCLKSIYVRNGIPLKIRSNTYVVGIIFLFDAECTEVKFEAISAESVTIYKA